ncbi:MAG: BatA domain-containing protein [Planctomycetota bacterium]|nr:BatA domain-containing protein [Planctomycetota bacterium]
MAFQHAAIFWTGAAAATVPIIIHLLNRTRFRPRVWAAMQFLLDSLKKNRRRLRIEELILLALRCGLLLVLAAALARFGGCAAMNLLPGRHGDNQAVFLLDDSLSMGQGRGGASVFSMASADLAELIGQVREEAPGTRLAVVRSSEASRGKFLQAMEEVKDPDALVAKLRALHPTDTRSDLAEALAAANAAFHPGGTGRELFVLSDFRRVDLTEKETVKRIQKELSALTGAGVRVTVIDYGRDGERNLTMEKMELASRYVLQAGKGREPARIRLSVRNNGAAPAQDVEVSLEAVAVENGQPVAQPLPSQRIARIEPSATVTIEFTYSPLRSGPVAVVAKLPDDELPGDNLARLVLDVRPDVRALIVDGNLDPADPERGEAFYFKYAVDPNGDGQYGCRPDVIDPRGLSSVRFADYDVVALLDVRAFPAEAASNNGEAYPSVAALERYVRQGGGLMIFTGEKTWPEFYNTRLYAGGAGLVPFKIQPRRGDPATGEFVRLAPESIVDESPMQMFTRIKREGVDISRLMRFYAFTPSTPAAPVSPQPYAGEPRVLARFTDAASSPAVVTREFGAGRTLMVYTSASLQWTDWPSDPAGTNVAFLLDAVGTLGRAQRESWAAVGEPVAYDLPADLSSAPVTLRTPGYPASDLVTLAPRTRMEEIAGDLKELAAQADKSKPEDARLGEALKAAADTAVAQTDARDPKGARESLSKVQAGLTRPGATAWATRAAGMIADALAAEDDALAVRRVAYRDGDVAGLYVLTLAPPGASRKDLLFARNADGLEGRLAHGGKDEVAAAFGSAAGDYRYFRRDQADRTEKMKLHPELEYWAWAMGAMLAMLALESFLGQRFGHHPPPKPSGKG